MKYLDNDQCLKIEPEKTHKNKTVVILTLFICVVLGVVNYCHLAHMQESHVMFSHLSTVEREMSFRTEMGFYYSFYKQVVEASSLSASYHLLTADNLTEYPNTINSLHRFNIYPEWFLAVLFRGIRNLGLTSRTCYSVSRQGLPPVESCEGAAEPAVFYVGAVLILNSVTLPLIFLSGWHLAGGSILGGFLSAALFLFNHRECTRVQWTPPLRESFSYPFLLSQQLCLLNLLKPQSNSLKTTIFSILYACCSLLALLSWQLAQFALLTQVAALFLAEAVCGDGRSRPACLRPLLLLLGADLANLCLQAGNSLLLTGPLRPAILVVIALLCLEPASIRSRLQDSPLAPLRWLTLAALLLLGIAATKMLLASVLGTAPDDGHMLDILRSKFSSFRSFDSLLYTCAPEFDFYDMSSLPGLTYTGLLPIAGAVALVLILYSCWRYSRLCLATAASSSVSDAPNFLTGPGFITPDSFFLLLQTAAYTLMAGLIMRLKLFWTPQLCLLSSIACNPRWSPSRAPRLLWPTLTVLVLASASVHGIANLKAEWSITGAYSNWEQEQLLSAISERTPPTAAFVGQMATMATVRLVTGRAVAVHPHYEDAGLRRRVHAAYSVYGRRSVREVWLMLRSELHASHLVFEPGYCGPRPMKPGCSYLDMWDLEEGTLHGGGTPLCDLLAAYIADARLGRRSRAIDVGRYFRWMFTSEGGAYSLLEVLPLPLP